MMFEVRVRRRNGTRIAQIVCILIAISILATFAVLIRARGSLIGLVIDSVADNVVGFVVGIFTIALVLPAVITFPMVSFYRERRPRIKVNGSEITFYPLWRSARKVTLSEITARDVKGDTMGEKIDAAVGGALFGLAAPTLAYGLQQRYDLAQQAPKGSTYTYYSGDKKLITLSTKCDLENLAQFDKMVVDKLAGRSPEPETSAGERRPTNKTKPPFILLGAGLIVCLAVVFACISHSPTATSSPNLLAGTSWLSGDDDSQWVFDTDGTFHWYQMKGKTDNNYFAGTYEFHIGQDAVHYLTRELSQYGITERAIKRVIASEQNHTLDNFICFSCVNQSFMLYGKEKLSEEVLSSYFGFLLQDGTYLDIVNMTTGTQYSFAKER